MKQKKKFGILKMKMVFDFFFFLKGQIPPNHLEVTNKNPKINEKDGDYILNEGDEDI